MEDLGYSIKNWEQEFQNGNTLLDYQKWLEYRIESDLEEIEAIYTC
jgi:hypothetical protein